MKRYSITITGRSPLLMHADNIEWADAMEEWKLNPENKKLSRAGDDRTPPHRWLGSLYHDGEVVAMPADNLMRCLMEGGAMVLVPGGRSGKTFKAQTQSGCMVAESFWPLLLDGEPIAVAPLLDLETEPSFAVHQKAAAAAGFSLFIKRAKIGSSKHVRVRPRFDRWALQGTLGVWDEQLTLQVLADIMRCAGEYKGLGDWRPSGRTPGPHGRFSAEITEV